MKPTPLCRCTDHTHPPSYSVFVYCCVLVFFDEDPLILCITVPALLTVIYPAVVDQMVINIPELLMRKA